jgi:hypothetical protein
MAQIMGPIVAKIWFKLPHNNGLVISVKKLNLGSLWMTGAGFPSTSEV